MRVARSSARGSRGALRASHASIRAATHRCFTALSHAVRRATCRCSLARVRARDAARTISRERDARFARATRCRRMDAESSRNRQRNRQRNGFGDGDATRAGALARGSPIGLTECVRDDAQ